MSALGMARMGFKAVGSLVFAVGMTVLAGTASATVPTSGLAQFCSSADYDNNLVQTTGRFTDLRRGRGINADYANCVLNITGTVGSAGDMWITLLDPPLFAGPTFQCVSISAEVLIRTFNNRKGVGFVTNYNAGSGKGLFLGLFDNGNSDALTLSSFDATTGQLTGIVANLFLGSKIQENTWYLLGLDICSDGANLFGNASVDGPNSVSEDLPFDVALPAGISSSGQIGIAGHAKSSLVDSSVKNFEWEASLPPPP